MKARRSRKERFLSQGYDKVQTLSLCRFNAQNRFGINKVRKPTSFPLLICLLEFSLLCKVDIFLYYDNCVGSSSRFR